MSVSAFILDFLDERCTSVSEKHGVFEFKHEIAEAVHTNGWASLNEVHQVLEVNFCFLVVEAARKRFIRSLAGYGKSIELCRIDAQEVWAVNWKSGPQYLAAHEQGIRESLGALFKEAQREISDTVRQVRAYGQLDTAKAYGAHPLSEAEKIALISNCAGHA